MKVLKLTFYWFTNPFKGTSEILKAAKKTDSKGFKLEDVLFTGQNLINKMDM